MDYTGTGNTLNPVHPACLRLIMDSLRYWVWRCTSTASASISPRRSAREFHAVDRLSAFFDMIHQDPVLSQVKLIAEPWDVGEGGYQVGNFPVLWTEWNGITGTTCATSGGGGGASEIRLPVHAAQQDLYELDGRAPYAQRSTSSPAHDGFTLARPGQSTTRSTTRRTARTTTTAPTTTTAGTAGSRGRPTTRR